MINTNISTKANFPFSMYVYARIFVLLVIFQFIPIKVPVMESLENRFIFFGANTDYPIYKIFKIYFLNLFLVFITQSVG